MTSARGFGGGWGVLRGGAEGNRAGRGAPRGSRTPGATWLASCLRGGGRGDCDRAASLLEEARATVVDLEMTALAPRLALVGEGASPNPRLRRGGSISFGERRVPVDSSTTGDAFRLKDSKKGPRYLVRLLRPREALHALALASPGLVGAPSVTVEEVWGRAVSATAGEILDAQISEHSPALGTHLERTIRTGTFRAEPADGQPLGSSASSVSGVSTRFHLQIGMIPRRERSFGTPHARG